MESDEIIRLIQLRLTGELTPEENNKLECWVSESAVNRDFLHVVLQEKLLSREYPLYHAIDEEKAIRRFEATIGKHKRKYISFKHILRAAAILVWPLVMVVVWQWNAPQPENSVTETIVPGSSRAVLTLAGGEQVELTGQTEPEILVAPEIEVRQKAGMLAYDMKGGERIGRGGQNVLATGRGGEYRLILADGTRVFLNAATILRYPVVFDDEVRRVQLEGEAYFEVAKDSGRPFVVETTGMEVKVYGTSFNINTLRINEIQTVLVEGSISICSVAAGREYRMCPGQLARWDKISSSVKLQEVDVSLYTAWKEGVFRFSRERLEEILGILANWYDVEVLYQNQEIKDLHFSGYMERYERIETILKALEEATGVHFSVWGKTITVSK